MTHFRPRFGDWARPIAPLPLTDPPVRIIMRIAKGLRIGFAIPCKKGIAGRNAIHFGTRIADWECNPFKKDFDDAWLCPKADQGLDALLDAPTSSSQVPRHVLSRLPSAQLRLSSNRICRV